MCVAVRSDRTETHRYSVTMCQCLCAVMELIHVDILLPCVSVSVYVCSDGTDTRRYPVTMCELLCAVM